MEPSILQQLNTKRKEENIDTISDSSTYWFLNEIRKLNGNEKIKLKEEIINEKPFYQFFPRQFYYFNYFPKESFREDPYDRTPFIFLFKKRGSYLHGLNINYLPTKQKMLFMNFLYRNMVGDMDAREEQRSEIFMRYEIMKARNDTVWERVIYRKYFINRISQVYPIPIKNAKMFSYLDTSFFPFSSISKIRYNTLEKILIEKRKQFRKSRKEI